MATVPVGPGSRPRSTRFPRTTRRPPRPGTKTAQLPRAAVLAAAGATVFALAYAFAPGEDDTVTAAKRPAAPAATSVPRPPAPAPSLATRPEIPPAAATDPFVAVSFVPPPPPAPVVVAPPPPPPPAPKAPPLPFTFVGLLERGAGKPAAFLARGEALLVVSEGDTVESDYRVESLSSTEVVLTYLPLRERQKLIVTGAKP